MHAKLNDNAVLFVADIFRTVVLNKINNKIILKICSINSVILIMKNFWRPHSAPRKTSYTDENISAGRRIYIISIDAVDVKMIDKKLGNNIITIETIKQIRPVIIRPDDTIDPIDFLLFKPE